ncbi:MAG: hypothetical protein REI64_03165 [Pedobacter sp.]|uniref:hypothetical protein n=1 Tax=Pedobacter sp. TaxID=1411316 RepID=UPI002808CA7A|nr:hypothetical protein [Pedobacter sp.]MDQ8003772.1 hypothetical protein [Pedobacter sp.]
MAITVISFTYQTSFGAEQVVGELNVVSQIENEKVDLVGAVVLVVGAFYAAGYALGRAVGHSVHGSEEIALAEISVHNPADFSSFDN